MATRLTDNAIVEMRFNNAQFEKNINKSIKSMEDLEDHLKNLDTGSAFDKLSAAASKIDLSGINKALSAVEYRLSSFGIAGAVAISRLTNSFINLGKSIWSATYGQMKSGGIARALNIQQAEFMLKGLGLDVQQVRDDAMFAVEDTAYGFDEAATAAANFGASGVKAGDDMKKALLGVSGVAAMTGADFASIADVFSTVASNGKLMTMQLRQFSSRGLNVSAALAKQLGKTEQQINDMVSKGKIDFKTFSDAMSEAFGSHAKDANKTFNGAISNVKAALSRIGAEFAVPITTDFIPTINALREVLNKIKSDMSPIIELWKNWSNIISQVFTKSFEKMKNSNTFSNIFHGLEHILKGIITLIFAMRQGFLSAFPQFKSLSEAFRVLTIYLMPTKEGFNGLVNIFKVIFSVTKIVIDVIRTAAHVFGVFAAIAYKCVEVFLSYVASISNVIDPMVQWIKENNIVEQALYAVVMIVYDLINGSTLLKSAFDKLIGGADSFVAFVKNIWSSVKSVASFMWELISTMDLGKIAVAGFIVSLAFLAEGIFMIVKRGIKVFTGFLYTIWNIFKQMGNVLSSFNYLLRQAGHAFNATTWLIVSEIILKTAISVGILALSLKLLSTISWEDLAKGGVALALLSAGLLGLSFALKKLFSSSGDLKSLAGQMGDTGSMAIFFISIASTITILSVVLAALSLLTPEQIAKGLVGIAGISAILIAIVGVTKLITKGSSIGDILKVGQVIGQFGSLAVTFLIMSAALKVLGSIGSNLGPALLAMTAIGAILVSMSFISKKLNGIKTSGFLSLAATLYIMSHCVKILADIDTGNPNALKNSVAALAALGGILVLMSAAQKHLKSGAVESKGFIKFAATLLIMTGCIAILSEIASHDDLRLLAAISALAALAGIIAVMTLITKKLDSGVNSKGFVKFAATLLIMTGCIAILSTIAAISPEAMGLGILALTSLAAIVVLVVAINKKLSSEGIESKGFIKFAATLLMLTVCLGIISAIAMINTSAMWQGVLAITALSALILAVAAAQKYLKIGAIEANGFIKFAAAILILSASLSMIEKAMQGRDPTELLLAVVAVGALAAVMVVVAQKMQNMKSISSAGIILFAAAIMELAAAVAVLALLPDADRVAQAAAIIAGLTVVMAIIAKLGQEFTIGAGTGFVLLASGILVLAVALGILISIAPQNDMLNCALSLGVLAAALAMMSRVMGDNGIAGAAAMILLATAMVPLAYALSLLADVPWQQIAIAATTLALFALAISGIAFIAEKAAAGIGLLSAMFLAVGLSMMMFGKGMQWFSESLNTMAEGLHNLASVSKEEIAQIINNIREFIVGLGLVCGDIIKMAPRFAAAFFAIGIAVGAAVGAIVIAVSNYAVLGILLFAALLLKSLPVLLETLGEIMDFVGVWFEEHEDQIYEFGRQVGHVFVDGLLGACEGVAEAMYDKIFGADVWEAKKSSEEKAKVAADRMRENVMTWLDMYDAGTYSAEQLVDGLEAGLRIGAISNEEAMEMLAERGLNAYKDKLGIHSPSLEMIKNGEWEVQGVIEGIKNKEYSLNQVMESLGAGAVNRFTSQFNTENLLSGVTGGLGGFLDDANKEKYYNQGMQTYQGKHVYEWDGYKTINDYIDAQQLKERNAAYDDLFKSFSEGFKFDAEDAADGIDSVSSSLSGYSDEAGKATEVTDKLKDAITDAMDVFTAFDDTAALTGRNVLQTFVTQIEGVNKWSEELQALASKGLNQNFLLELADEGPNAYAKIHAFYSMTEAELNLFNQMYAQKLSIQKNTANNIRKSFVSTGNMLQETADKYANKIGDSVTKTAEENGDKLTKTEIKNAQEAKEAAERELIDNEFIEKWTAQVSSESSKLAFADAFSSLGYASMESLNKSISFELILDKLITFKNDVKEQVRGGLNLFEDIEEKEEISSKKMLTNMRENVRRVGKWAENLSKLAARGMSEGLLESLRQLGPEAADKVEAFVKMTDEELSRANSYYQSSTNLDEHIGDKMVSTYAKAGFESTLGLKKGLEEGKDDLMFAYQETGEAASEGFVKGIDPDAAKQVIERLGTNTLGYLKDKLDIHSPSHETYVIGVQTVDGFTEGIEDPSANSRLRAAIMRLGTTVIGEHVTSAFSKLKFITVAKNCIDGLTIGFQDSLPRVMNAVNTLGTSILSKFASVLKINSPSKEFAWCAEMCNLGFANTMTSDNTAIDATENKADSILNAFSQKMLDMGYDLGEDNVYEPVIRPVWDMEAVTSGFNTIDSYLASRPFDISGTVNNVNNATNKYGLSNDAIAIMNAIKETTNNNAAMRQELNKMGDDITNLGTKLERMYIRLDGNAVVGQLMDPLDAAMGSKVVRQRRNKG